MTHVQKWNSANFCCALNAHVTYGNVPEADWNKQWRRQHLRIWETPNNYTMACNLRASVVLFCSFFRRLFSMCVQNVWQKGVIFVALQKRFLTVRDTENERQARPSLKRKCQAPRSRHQTRVNHIVNCMVLIISINSLRIWVYNWLPLKWIVTWNIQQTGSIYGYIQ